MLFYVCQKPFKSLHLRYYGFGSRKLGKIENLLVEKDGFFVTKMTNFRKSVIFTEIFAQIVLESTTDHLKTILNNKNNIQ